jgi:hypothetical protein
MVLRSVGVFCGSRAGRLPAYAESARAFGAGLGRAGLSLVYGGARNGLMGELASAAAPFGHPIIGVIPQTLARTEFAHPALTEALQVGTLAERKTVMIERSDAFVALAGGWGTLDELFEVLTLAQLKLHQKPIALLDTCGYFEGLHAWLRHAHLEGFALDPSSLLVERAPDVLLTRLAQACASAP